MPLTNSGEDTATLLGFVAGSVYALASVSRIKTYPPISSEDYLLIGVICAFSGVVTGLFARGAVNFTKSI